MAGRFGITPESLLSGLRRNDSKNPHTTCRGITTNGRPCRRSLAAAVRALNSTSPEDERASVVAVLEEDEVGSEITAFFCWQHKDQADSYHVGRAKKVEVRSRGSLEDMLSSIGLQDAKDIRRAIRKPVRQASKTGDNGQALQEPRTHVGQCFLQQAPLGDARRTSVPRQPAHPDQYRRVRRKKVKETSLWDVFSNCFRADERSTEQDQPARQHKRSSNTPLANSQYYGVHPQRPSTHIRNDSKMSGQSQNLPIRRKSDPPAGASLRPPAHLQRPRMSGAHSQPQSSRKMVATKDVVSPALTHANGAMAAASTVIPRDASLLLASSLMAEMSKISQDPWEGYIYMYWLDEADADDSDSDDTGASFLTSTPQRSGGNRNTTQNTILLKIGRAENVHGRLSQWQRQCRYRPRLVRCYPGSDSRSDHKVQHLHRVERLIHLELGEKNVKKQCRPCGREHREWFEASGREGVREVDRIIRKWIDWSANQPHS